MLRCVRVDVEASVNAVAELRRGFAEQICGDAEQVFVTTVQKAKGASPP